MVFIIIIRFDNYLITLLGGLDYIKLLINPNEADHQELVRLIECADEKLIESINNKISNRSEFETIGRDIVTQSQIVLKKEWQRVKSGQ